MTSHSFFFFFFYVEPPHMGFFFLSLFLFCLCLSLSLYQRSLYLVFSLKFSSLSLNWSESLELNLKPSLQDGSRSNLGWFVLSELRPIFHSFGRMGWHPFIVLQKRSWPSGGRLLLERALTCWQDEGELLRGRRCPANSLIHFLVISILEIKHQLSTF